MKESQQKQLTDSGSQRHQISDEIVNKDEIIKVSNQQMQF